jgi:hypothetical protein
MMGGNLAVECIAYVANIHIDNFVPSVFGEPTHFCHSWQHTFNWWFMKSYGACIF